MTLKCSEFKCTSFSAKMHACTSDSCTGIVWRSQTLARCARVWLRQTSTGKLSRFCGSFLREIWGRGVFGSKVSPRKLRDGARKIAKATPLFSETLHFYGSRSACLVSQAKVNQHQSRASGVEKKGSGDDR